MKATQENEKPMVGRYAPSPTGDLHLGNLRTALLAWLYSRLQGGRFLLRIEDTDVPRVVLNSDQRILQDLDWLGIDWDGDVVYQSSRLKIYGDLIESLCERGLVYPCFCSRKDIRLAGSAPHSLPGVYPGTCSELSDHEVATKKQNKLPAYRLRVSRELKNECGDIVVRRADDMIAYQFAVVVDDLDQGITDVVRGADLLDSTERQRFLASVISPSSSPINYHHVPLVLDDSGQRFSKRDGSDSARVWREGGGSAETLIGEFAFQLGLLDSNEPISAHELLREVSFTQVVDCTRIE